MFTASNIQYEHSDRVRGLASGGIGAMHRLVRHTGLVEAIDRRQVRDGHQRGPLERDRLIGEPPAHLEGQELELRHVARVGLTQDGVAVARNDLTGVQGVYERSDVDVRQKEGLENVAGLVWGEAPPSSSHSPVAPKSPATA